MAAYRHWYALSLETLAETEKMKRKTSRIETPGPRKLLSHCRPNTAGV
jgi:hypothetical protein